MLKNIHGRIHLSLVDFQDQEIRPFPGQFRSLAEALFGFIIFPKAAKDLRFPMKQVRRGRLIGQPMFDQRERRLPFNAGRVVSPRLLLGLGDPKRGGTVKAGRVQPIARDTPQQFQYLVGFSSEVIG